MPCVVVSIIFCTAITVYQIVKMVEITRIAEAINPTVRALSSFEVRYLIPFHLPISKKQTSGRAALNAYSLVCDHVETESCSSRACVPQLGQK